MQNFRCLVLRPLGFRVIGSGQRPATTSAQTIADPDLEKAKPFSEIPGVTGVLKTLSLMKDFLPVVGKYGSGDISLPEVHMDMYRQYGPISRVDVLKGKVRFVFLFDPDDIRKVFQHEGRYPRRDTMQPLAEHRLSRPDLYASAGILIDNDEQWHHVRSKVQGPMLKPQIVETYLPKMESVSKDFVNRIEELKGADGEVPDFMSELFKWSLEAVGLVAFNTRLGCLSPFGLDENSEAQQVINATLATFESLLILEMKAHWKTIFPRKYKMKLAAAQGYLLSVASKYCNMTLNQIKTSNDKDAGILGELLQREDLDIRDVHTFTLDLLAAGIETTAITAGFTLYLLARNTTAQQNIHRELDSVLPSPDQPITSQVIHQLPILRASVKEAMRMMCVAEGTVRVLDHPVSLSGFKVPAGVTLFLLTQVASLLPVNFPDGDQFRPERWMDGSKSHPYSHLPFGHGPRACIGRHIALQEIYLFLIKLFQHFQVEYHHDDIKRISRLSSIPDKPLRFSFVKRKI